MNAFDIDITPSSSSNDEEEEEEEADDEGREQMDEGQGRFRVPIAPNRLKFLNGGGIFKDVSISNVPGNDISSDTTNFGAQKIDFTIYGNDGTDRGNELPRAGFSGPVFGDVNAGNSSSSSTTTSTTTPSNNNNNKMNRFNTSYGVGRGPRPSVVTDQTMYDPDIPNLSKGGGGGNGKKGKGTDTGDGKKKELQEGSSSSSNAGLKSIGERVSEAELKRELFELVSRLDAPIVKFANKYLSVATSVGSDSLTLDKLISINDVNLETYPTDDFTSIIKTLYTKNYRFADLVSAHLSLALYEKYSSAIYDENSSSGLNTDEVEDILAFASKTSTSFDRKSVGGISKYFLSREEIGRGGALRKLKKRRDASKIERRGALGLMLQAYASSIVERYPNTSMWEASFMFNPVFLAKIENAITIIQVRTGKSFTVRQMLFSDTVSNIFANLLFFLDKDRETSSVYSYPISDHLRSVRKSLLLFQRGCKFGRSIDFRNVDRKSPKCRE